MNLNRINEGKKTRIPYTSNLLSSVKLNLTENVVSLSQFDQLPYIINVRNGLIDLRDGYFYEHKQGGDHYYSFTQFPIDYDPNAECLTIDRFLEDIFGFKAVPNVYEMIGYIISPDIRFKIAWLLYGVSNTGKTTFVESLLVKFVGFNNAKMISLFDLPKRFQLANLRSKRLCYYDDLPEGKKLTNASLFRILTGTTDNLEGEMKGVQAWAKWKNTTKLVFTTNFLPDLPENTGDEFFNRWIITMCDTEFTEETRDLDMKDKITTDQEFSGLLNQAIKGYQRLTERKKFEDHFTLKNKVKATWQLNTNPVKLFLIEKCSKVVGCDTERHEFLAEVNAFRKGKGVGAISLNLCTKALDRLDDPIKVKFNNVDKKRYYQDLKIIKPTIKSVNRPTRIDEYGGEQYEDDQYEEAMVEQ